VLTELGLTTTAQVFGKVSFPSPGGLAYAESIDTWAAMTKKGNSTASNLSYSTDDGVTWTNRTTVVGTFSTSTGADGEALDWSPTLGLFVVGGNTGRIAVSSDGQTWTASQPAAFGTSQVISIHWSAGDALFYAGTSNNDFATSTDGTTWALSATEPGGASSTDIRVVSSVGTRVFVGKDNGTIYYSDDLGDSWTQSTITGVAIGSGDVSAIVSNTDGSVIVAGGVGFNNAEYVWRSTDNGVSFASVDVATQIGIANIYCLCMTYDAGYGFIQGGRDPDINDEQIIMTSPDGLTWTLRLSEKGTHFDAANNPVTSITSSGTLATLTAPGTHYLSATTTIIISGADQSEYNGTFAVASPSGATLQYTMLSDPAIDTATGTIEYRFLDRGDIVAIQSKGGVGPSSIAYLYTYNTLRVQEELIETFKFVNAFVYENDTKDTLAQIPVYDPFKGIIPGNADLNIKYRVARDPARYTNASVVTLVNEDQSFDGDQVGELWWDLSTCAYLYYEQDTDTYRRDNWGTLFNGSSVDMYEWTRTTTLPAEYDGDGTVRNETDYVLSQEWDPILEEVRTYYYYWVKDRTVIPGVKNRTIAAFEVANIIRNPAANLYQWFSPVSQTGFMFSGVDSVFTDSDNIFQINYRRQDDEHPTHVEWELGRENDTNYVINDVHWDKMVDSICGYTDEIDIGATVFTDITPTFETDATSVITIAPDMIVCHVTSTFVTDITGVNAGTNRIGTVAIHGYTTGDAVVYSTRFPGAENVGLVDGITYYVNVVSDTNFSLHVSPTDATTDTARITLNVSGAETHAFCSEAHGLTDTAEVIYSVEGGTAISTLVDGGHYFVEVITSTAIALHPTYSAANAANAGTRIDVIPAGSAETHMFTETVLTLNNFNNAIPTVDDPTKGYLVVPDPDVSEQNKFGINIRPMQTMFVDIQGARRVFVNKINDLVETIILRDDNPTWNSGLTTNNLWEWVDWYEVDYDATNAVPIRQVTDTSDLATLPNPFDGDMVKVTGTRWSLYEYSVDTGLYSLVGREASRLNLLSSIYEDSPSLATAIELRDLIAALQTEVFVNDLAINNNLVFFALLNYVFSEQDDIDWAFKTTYIFLDQTGQVLTQDRVFQDDPFDSALDYINEAKPYQTKVRDFRITRATETDEVLGTAEETSRTFNINMMYDQIRGGDLSVTEMRIAKAEGTADTTYNGYSTLDAGATLVRLGAAGRAVLNFRTELAEIPHIISDDLADFDPSQLGPLPTVTELEAVAAINAAITEAFFFDYQGSLLQNTSFGGLPTLKSLVISFAGTGGYLVGDLLELDAGGGVPISPATLRVETLSGAGVATVSVINGGSYQQTPTSDPVALIGGSGNNDATATMLIFENGSSVPHDTTPWDQIGFESSVFDEAVTRLDGLGDSADTLDLFADIPAEETFSGDGLTKEFDLTTIVPTFFMFAVVNGVEQVLNVDYFFIGSTLTFVSVLDSNGKRAPDMPDEALPLALYQNGAPPTGVANIELYTYIEAGDLINPQVSAGIAEEMVPLDPRENLIIIADTHNITIAGGGAAYVGGDVGLTETIVGGTGTAMTIMITAVNAGAVTEVAIVDSGAYTALPGAGVAITTVNTTGSGATIDVIEPSYSFRLHNDTRRNFFITRNEEAMSTTTIASVGLTDHIISVTDETLLYDTAPTVDAPQVAWIGTERILYHGVNAVANQIIGCVRGTNGTRAQTHLSGAKVYGTEDQAVPTSPYVYWVDTLSAGYQTGTPSAGLWTFHGNGDAYFTDGAVTTMVSTNGIVVGDTLRITNWTPLNLSYYIKDLIATDEIQAILVSAEGSGYAVGDNIPIGTVDSLLGGSGLLLSVGKVDSAGGIMVVNVDSRGSGYAAGGVLINVTGAGNNDAQVSVSAGAEGIVIAQTAELINEFGLIVEGGALTWELDRALPGGLTTATTAAALFLNGGLSTSLTGSGNALPL